MHPFNTILDCLCTGYSSHYDVLDEQPALDFSHEKKHPPQTTQLLAENILSTLYAANKNDENLVRRIQDIVRETGWYESLAAAALTGLENALKAEAPMGKAMRDAYDTAAQAVAEVLKFAKDHPVWAISKPWKI
jgi:hypothetical protein